MLGTELVAITGEVPARYREMLGSPCILMLVTFIPGLPVLIKKTKQTPLWARLEKCPKLSVIHMVHFPLGWKKFYHGILGKKIKQNQKKQFTSTWKGKQLPACPWVWSAQLILHSKAFFSLVLLFLFWFTAFCSLLLCFFKATCNKGTKPPHLWSIEKLFCISSWSNLARALTSWPPRLGLF